MNDSIHCSVERHNQHRWSSFERQRSLYWKGWIFMQILYQNKWYFFAMLHCIYFWVRNSYYFFSFWISVNTYVDLSHWIWYTKLTSMYTKLTSQLIQQMRITEAETSYDNINISVNYLNNIVENLSHQMRYIIYLIPKASS